MKKIPINSRRGVVDYALVDDEDYELVSQYKWHLANRGYAIRAFRENGIIKSELMTRMIMNAPVGILVDHKDHNPLNNQKYNLRLATPLENARNKVKSKKNPTSRFLGVCWHKRDSNWVAQIAHKWIGNFDDEILAAKAFDSASVKLYGEFASLNFPVTSASPSPRNQSVPSMYPRQWPHCHLRS